jgi:two-component system OmpR family response regulator
VSKLILHLDDEAPIREILELTLVEAGYRVVSVATAQEALAAVAQQPPDLVITDLQLDESDGLESIDRLRVLLPKVPIILLTGVLLNPRVAEKSLAGRVDAYIAKTTPLARILEEVKRLAGA